MRSLPRSWASFLNLAVWFALHVSFRELYEARGLGMTIDVPVLSSVHVASLILTLGAMLAVFRFKIGMLTVLAGCSFTAFPMDSSWDVPSAPIRSKLRQS